MEGSHKDTKAQRQVSEVRRLLERQNNCLRNALYWMRRESSDQAEGAMLEARGITLRLAEKEVGANIGVFDD